MSPPLPPLLLLLLVGMSCTVGSAGDPGSAGWYARDGAAAAEAMGLDGSTGDVVAVGAASALQVAQGGAEGEDDGGDDDDVEAAGDGNGEGDGDMQMKTCAPTPRDVLGPFYLPGAPPLKYFCRRDKSVAATPQLKMKGWVKDASVGAHKQWHITSHAAAACAAAVACMRCMHVHVCVI